MAFASAPLGSQRRTAMSKSVAGNSRKVAPRAKAGLAGKCRRTIEKASEAEQKPAKKQRRAGNEPRGSSTTKNHCDMCGAKPTAEVRGSGAAPGATIS